MSKNTDEVLGHADESDGIEEYDNPLPDWWIGLFFLTIIWGVWHIADWHFITPTSNEAHYEAEMAAAAEQWPDLGKKAERDDSPETLALGKELYTANCVACHMADLSGGIGPNLKDSEWIHGGDYESVVNTLTNGVAAKGMPAWGPVLGPKKVAALASYVLSENTGEAPAAPAEEPAAAPEGGAEGTPTDVEAGPADGKAIFEKNCVACHKADLSGLVGPNLKDDEWIHGGSLEEIVATITNGVPEKGMISWKTQLSDEEIAAVAKYVFEYED